MEGEPKGLRTSRHADRDHSLVSPQTWLPEESSDAGGRLEALAWREGLAACLPRPAQAVRGSPKASKDPVAPKCQVCSLQRPGNRAEGSVNRHRAPWAHVPRVVRRPKQGAPWGGPGGQNHLMNIKQAPAQLRRTLPLCFGPGQVDDWAHASPALTGRLFGPRWPR